MSNITLKALHFNNMFSYGPDITLQLDKDKMTLLSAPNGYGKTTLAYIIQELLYSSNVKKIKKADIVNRYSGSNVWNGSLEFQVDNDEYKISVRRQGATSKVTLFKNGTDISEHKIPDTYKKIKKILGGYDMEVFSQLTYQSSRNLLKFLDATDTERKKFLIKLFNLEFYLEIGDLCKIKYTTEERELLKKEGELDGVVGFLTNNIIENKLESIIVPEIDSSLKNKIQDLELELRSYKNQCRKIDGNNLYIQERDELNFEIDMQEPIRWDNSIYQKTNRKLAETETSIKDKKQKLKGLDLSDVCYACGQIIDNSKNKELQLQLESDKKDLVELRELLLPTLREEDNKNKEFTKQITVYRKNQTAIKRFEDLAQLIDNSLSNEYPDFNKITLELQEVTEKYKEQVKEKESAETYNNRVQIRNSKIDVLVTQRREFLARQQLLENDIINSKSKLNNLAILRKAFSPSGLVAFKLESLVKNLEDNINNYLVDLSDGQFQIIFRLTGEKLNIVLFSNGKEAPLETASAGEFSRIQTAVLFAIRKILSETENSFINLLFLDEIDGVLDVVGKEKLVDLILTQKINVFIISHSFDHPLLEKLHVIKEGNFSRLEQ